MNDNELDEMLNKWEAPEAPARLRQKLMAAMPVRRRRFNWMSGFVPRVLATAVLGLGALILVVSRATPQTGNVPYVVESEVTQFFNDGSQDSAHITSYNHDGSEVMLSLYKPDSPFSTLLGQLARTVHGSTLGREAPNRAAMAEALYGCSLRGCLIGSSMWFVGKQELLQSKCEAEGRIVGHENILGYPTVAVEASMGGVRKRKLTLWRAPGLGCFALRVKAEALAGDSYVTTDLKQALKVTVH